jgi:hypothetical protein
MTMQRYLSSKTTLMTAIGLLSEAYFGSPAMASQIIPGGVEYTNDKIEKYGRTLGCMIVVAIVSPPAPEIVNFQYLFVNARHGIKVAVADVDYQRGSAAPVQLQKANFSSRLFTHYNAFDGKISPEGSCVGFLKQNDVSHAFASAFFRGNYTISFERSDVTEARSYYIEQSPPRSVTDAFVACSKSIR